MSDFVQQQHTICNFSNEGSWVILSPIEQSIKQKIESVGTPLKDWDIKIYRGVLTGYNDAFIISTEKRDEILANCQTEDERLRTAELIRPNSLRNLKYPDERKKPTTAKKRSNVAISEAIPFNLSKSVLPSLLLKNFVLIMLVPIVSCQETDIIVQS